MYNLVIKEFLLQKKYMIIYVLYGIGIAVAACFTPGIVSNFFYVFYITTASYLSVMYSNGYEMRGQSEVMLNSLPVNREQIINAKYIYLQILIILYSILIFIFSFVARIINKSSTAAFSINMYVISFIVLGLVFSIYYPLYFKLGREKLRVVTLFFYLIIFVSPEFYSKAAINPEKYHLVKVLTFVTNNSNLVLISLSAVVILLLIASSSISARIYKNKEF